MTSTRTALCLSLLSATGCSLILDVEVDPAIGFGTACTGADDCVSGLCQTGRCTKTCSDADPCGAANTACSAGVCQFLSPPPLENLNVGLLYVGPVIDHGWTKTHEDARQYWTQQLGARGIQVQSSFEQTVAIANAGNVIDRFLGEGKNVIIGTSFDFLNPILTAAPNNPDVNFLLCSGFTTTPNLGSYFGRMESALYQAGYLAGKMSQTHRIGMVNPVAIPETVRHANAFARGALDADPRSKVVIRWVEAWFDPPVEEAAANELIADGVDVLMNQTDTTIPIVTANSWFTRGATLSPPRRQIYTIGYDNADSCNFARETCIGSAYWNWGPMVTDILTKMHEGTWRPDEVIYEQIESDASKSPVALNIPATQIERFPALSNIGVEVGGLLSHLTAPTEEARHYPFRAPLKDNQGRTRLAEGQQMTDERVLRMCWFVEGIVGIGDTLATIPANCIGEREPQ